MANRKFSRKNFLKIAGTSAASVFALAGCELNSIPPPDPPPGLNLGPDPRPDDFSVYLGSGDTGLFNFAYAIAQLETAFYVGVTNSPFDGMTTQEQRILADIRDHEIAHRDFFNEFLGPNSIHGLNFEFGFDFSSRESVLQAAVRIEDAGVSAYNILPELIDQTRFVVTLNKIASVEARHASAVRNLRQPNTAFFISPNTISSQGLDVFNTPVDVLNILGPFIIERLDITELPKVRR